MDGVSVPISIRLGARLKTFRAGDQPRPPGVLRDITIKNLRVTGARQIGLLINGIPGHPVKNLTLKNIQIELAGGGSLADAGFNWPKNRRPIPNTTCSAKSCPLTESTPGTFAASPSKMCGRP